MARIKLNVIAVFSEHCFTQHSWILIQDTTDHKMWNQLTSVLRNAGVEIYFNHFVVKCEDDEGNEIYLGYNDNVISFGFSIGKLEGSKEITLESPQKLRMSF